MNGGTRSGIRSRYFYSPGASLVTLAFALLLAWMLWHVIDWAVIRATTAPTVAVCKEAGRGACWGFVIEKWRLILFGRYPYDVQWRPAIATLAVVAMLIASAWPALWSRRGARVLIVGWIAAFAVFFTLMLGGVFGLELVGTERWGGLPLTVILTLIGMSASAPIGVLLALARRSEMPLLKTLATAYIELVRGVPLITVLFVATFVFPLVLPQALVAVIPAFVNNLLSTFMDTSLVTVVSMYDLTGALRLALGDPLWRDFFIEGYAFIAAIYFCSSLVMSRYSQWLETRLTAGVRH